MKPHLLIVAGDPSADRHAAALVRALKAQRPEIRITALGGDHLRAVADTFAYPLVGIGGFGFWEPIVKLPQLWKAKETVRQILADDPPTLVVPMDYYGFNIHVARMAHAAQIPVVYYISPQVWASRPGRIQKLKAVVKEMLVILPFEVKPYESAGVPVHFVGHPLIETLPEPEAPPAKIVVGLLPGSRRGVTKRHLPIMVETVQRLKLRFPEIEWVLFRPQEIEAEFYAEALSQAPQIRLVCDENYVERRRLSFAISVSGTSSLENMLLGIPMIIMYKLSPLTYAIAKRLIRIPWVGMPNILANAPVVPELLQDKATPELIASAAGLYLSSSNVRHTAREALLNLRSMLEGGGSRRAAEEIIKLLPAADRLAPPQKIAL